MFYIVQQNFISMCNQQIKNVAQTKSANHNNLKVFSREPENLFAISQIEFLNHATYAKDQRPFFILNGLLSITRRPKIVKGISKHVAKIQSLYSVQFKEGMSKVCPEAKFLKQSYTWLT